MAVEEVHSEAEINLKGDTWWLQGHGQRRRAGSGRRECFRTPSKLLIFKAPLKGISQTPSTIYRDNDVHSLGHVVTWASLVVLDEGGDGGGGEL